MHVAHMFIKLAGPATPGFSAADVVRELRGPLSAAGQRLIVLDTSAAVEYLLDFPDASFVAEQLDRTGAALAPHLLDGEILGVLRRNVALATLDESRAVVALAHLASLRIVRFPLLRFVPRVWELRHTVSTADAFFVALAEEAGVPLVTTDRRLAHTHGHRAVVLAP